MVPGRLLPEADPETGTERKKFILEMAWGRRNEAGRGGIQPGVGERAIAVVARRPALQGP